MSDFIIDGPYRYGSYQVEGRHGATVCRAVYEHHEHLDVTGLIAYFPHEQRQMMRRIAACLNVFQGVATEYLEDDDIQTAVRNHLKRRGIID